MFKPNTGIKSGPDAFDEQRLVITFWTNLGVTEIFLSFRLPLEGNAGKEIRESSRLELLEKFSSNNFALLDAEVNFSGPLNKEVIADLRFLRTLLPIRQTSWEIRQTSWEIRFWKVMGSFVFSKSKFGSFMNSCAMITELSKLRFRCRRFTLLVQTKGMVSMRHGSSTSSWKPWRSVKLELIFTIKDI